MKISMPFSICCWGCRSQVKELVSRYNLEWVWINEGGYLITEYIEGKVTGEYNNMLQFRRILEKNLM